MKASVSLWSADLMEVGTTVDRLTGVADGFHVDVMDGQFAPSLLFGPDFVRALRGRTDAVLDVHLVVAEADRWVETFAEAGADVLTVYPESSSDLSATLEAIRALGTSPGVSVNLDYPMGPVREFADLVDRVLIMGTESGSKGAGLDRRALERVGEVRQWQGPEGRPEIYVDGGIRRHTVPEIALAGADGVIPGSLIFDEESWEEAVRWVHSQQDVRQARNARESS
jgi:ribulose-phosphate 3-epimerase